MAITYTGLFSGFDLEDLPALKRLSIALRYYKTSGLFAQPYQISASLNRSEEEMPKNSLERSNIGDIWLTMNTKPIIAEIINEFMIIDMDNPKALLAGGARLRRYVDPLLDNWPLATTNRAAKKEARFDELFDGWRRKHFAPNIPQPMDPRINRIINLKNKTYLDNAVAKSRTMAVKQKKEQAVAPSAMVGYHNYTSSYSDMASSRPVTEQKDGRAVPLLHLGRILPTVMIFNYESRSDDNSTGKALAQLTVSGKDKQATTPAIVTAACTKKIKLTLTNLKASEYDRNYGKGSRSRTPIAKCNEIWVAGNKRGAQRHTPLKKKGETIVDDGNVDFTRPNLGVADVSKLHIRLVTTTQGPETGKTIPGIGLDRVYGRDVNWDDNESVKALDKWRNLCYSRDFGHGWKQRPGRWLQIEKDWTLNFLLENSDLHWAGVCIAYNKKFSHVMQAAGESYVKVIGYKNETMAEARKGPARMAEDIQAVASYWPEYQAMIASCVIGKGLFPPEKRIVIASGLGSDASRTPKKNISLRLLNNESSSPGYSSPDSANSMSSLEPMPLTLNPTNSRSSGRPGAAKASKRKYESSLSDMEDDDEMSEVFEEPEDSDDGNYGVPKRTRR